ncbi:MAG: ParA family protein [Chloroflexota bacterium]
MTYMLSITNEKGGVAKTTTALSLGAALVEAGKSVLLVDLDSQANLTLALGCDPLKAQHTIISAAIDQIPLDQVWQETGIPNLYLVPANHEMSYAERILPSRPGYEHSLRQVFSAIELPFDFVIFDCPPFLGAMVVNALTTSDMLLIPTQAEYFSIYALKNMMNLVRRIRAQSNPTLSYRILLTLYDRRNRIHRTLSEQLRASFGNGVLETIIMVDTRLRESSIAGLPIIYHAPKCRSALQYRELAQEMLQYVEKTVAQPA